MDQLDGKLWLAGLPASKSPICPQGEGNGQERAASSKSSVVKTQTEQQQVAKVTNHHCLWHCRSKTHTSNLRMF